MKSKALVILYTAIIIAAMGAIMMFTVYETVSNSFNKQIEREQDGRLRIAHDFLLQYGKEFRIREDRLYVGDTLLDGNQGLVDQLGSVFGGIVTIYRDDRPIATNVRLPDGSPAIGNTVALMSDEARGKLFGGKVDEFEEDVDDKREGAKYRDELEIQQDSYITSYDFVRNPEGVIIGALQVGTLSAPYRQALNEVFNRTTIATLGAIVLVAVVVFVALNLLTKEIARMSGRAKALLDSTREGVFGMDHDGRCTFINHAGCMFLGYTPDEVIGEDMALFIRPPAPEGSLSEVSFIKQAAQANDLIATEDEFVRKDGTRFPVRYFVAPVLNEGKVEGYVLSFMNVAEEKKAAQRLAEMTERLESIIQSAQSAQRAKSAFFATTGAEISRSGEKIRQAAEYLLGSRNGSGDEAEKLQNVRRAAESLLLTNELVGHLSELESGRVKKDAAPFKVAECVDGALAAVRPLANDRQVQIVSKLAAEVPAEIMGDLVKTREVAVQILRHAVSTANQGSTVTLEVGRTADSQLVFSAAGVDSFDAERLKRVVEAYRDADDAAIRDFGLSGLGIMVARNLAGVLGGTVRAAGGVLQATVPIG
jgi:PAS domain S-box-containing protein